MFTATAITLFIVCTAVSEIRSFCGDSIRWSHTFNMEDVYGMWYGVGYAQHTPDMTNKPNEVGCVTIYITDATNEYRNDRLDWSLPLSNYNNSNWRSQKSNPWSDYTLSGSWMDVSVKRRAKRTPIGERRIRIMWDEDGQTLEQTYLYAIEEPGLWTLEKLRPREREMESRGIDIWYPDELPRHPEVIRILKVNSHVLILNHCSEIGRGGMFSLVLRRSPSRIDRWEWYDLRKQFYNFNLPNLIRYSAVCKGCVQISSVLNISLCLIFVTFLKIFK